jgi:hypothetical protein
LRLISSGFCYASHAYTQLPNSSLRLFYHYLFICFYTRYKFAACLRCTTI